MQQRHLDNDQYFQEQIYTTRKYVIPYISQVKNIDSTSLILEVGCGEGGNLYPFCEMGCPCYGVDIDAQKIAVGQEKLPYENVTLIYKDIYDIEATNFPKFDVIFLRDVIEHIPHQDRFLTFIRGFLKDDGVIFFAFPPWRMPFGGHQQILRNRVLSKLPYYHILPKSIYKKILRWGKVPDSKIKEMLSIKETGISIHRFRKLAKESHFKIEITTDWLINPNYEVKFNLKPRKLHVLNHIPYFRDFFTTCYYCTLTMSND
jgi:SAM-dependent methyltransferase